MGKNKKVPKIRFKGFGENWEQRRLEEVAKYRNGKAHENDISESGKYVVVNSKFVSTNGEVRKYSKNQIEPLYKNEVAFVLSDVPNGRAIARTFIVDEDDKYTLNQRIAGITPNNITSPYFLYILMNRNKYFLKFDDGVKQTNLSLNDVLEFKELYPNYEEQKQIGTFFSNLDSLITLHQRKLDNLQTYKKTMLSKMFPKNDKNVPEFRFKGFTDPWEQRKLGEVAEIFDGTHQTPKYKDSGIKFVSVENIATLETEKFITKEAFEKEYSNKQAEKNDVLMTRIGDIGTTKVIESDEPLAYYVTLALLKPQNIDSNFLSWAISSSAVQHDIWKRTLHIAFPKKINLGEIKEISLMVSTITEQKKIGKFFKDLDDLITLHQRKLENLQDKKEYFLRHMFI